MKTLRIPLFSGALLGLCLARPVMAQETSSGNAPSTDQTQPSPLPPPPPRGPMANLTEQERVQLKAAHDKAIQQNPSLEQAMTDARQAMEKARKAMHDAMIAIDPSVEPILTKIEPPKKWGVPAGGQGRGPGKATEGAGGWKHHAPPPGMANLSEQERTQLKATHEQIKSDPSIVSARDAVKAATSPEARRAAHEALRQAADAAMLKVDPSLGPILEKLHQGAPPQPVPSASACPEAMMPAMP